MTYDAQGRLSAWTAPSGTSVNEYLLYDNEGNLVLTSTSTSGDSTDTFTFDSYTKPPRSGALGSPVTTSS